MLPNLVSFLNKHYLSIQTVSPSFIIEQFAGATHQNTRKLFLNQAFRNFTENALVSPENISNFRSFFQECETFSNVPDWFLAFLYLEFDHLSECTTFAVDFNKYDGFKVIESIQNGEYPFESLSTSFKLKTLFQDPTEVYDSFYYDDIVPIISTTLNSLNQSEHAKSFLKEFSTSLTQDLTHFYQVNKSFIPTPYFSFTETEL